MAERDESRIEINRNYFTFDGLGKKTPFTGTFSEHLLELTLTKWSG